MADVLKLDGSVSIETTDGSMPSGDFERIAKLVESMTVKRGVPFPIELSADAPVTVTFPVGMVAAHFVLLRVASGGGPVLAQFSATTPSLSDQSVQVDPIALIMNKTNGITGLKLTRSAGVATTVKVLLAERA